MLGYIDKIREISTTLLSEGKVDMVIGFREGTMPMMNEPCMVKSPEQVKSLVWDSNCGINLTNYVTDRKEKIGIVAKGCDSRNIVTHIIENKIKRDQLFIIGVPCQGMVDKKKIAGLIDGEIDSMTESDGKILIQANGKEISFGKNEVLQKNCVVCQHPNPVIYDELVGELVEAQNGIDRFEDVRQIESMGSDQKWAYFEDLLSNCIRCYACRNACPLCYCPSCFVDDSRPQWVGKSADETDTRTFHFLRAFHCAGRCTDCGACERACPVGINMRVFTKKLEKDCFEMFHWEAGLTLDERPPLDTFKPDDPQEFIK